MNCKRWYSVLSGAALVTVFVMLQSAQADVTFGGSSAYGVQSGLTVSSNTGPSGTLTVVPTPSLSGTAPPAFSGSQAGVPFNLSTSFGIAGTAGLGANIFNVTLSSDVDGTLGAHSANAQASVGVLALNARDPDFGSINLLYLPLVGTSSQSQVTGDFGALIPTGSSTIAIGDFFITGINVAPIVFASFPNPAPNTTFTIDSTLVPGVSGSITVVLNEQIISGDGSTNSSITTNAIDLTFNSLTLPGFVFGHTLTLDGTLILGQSQASLVAGPSGGGAQPVPEPSSLAMLGVAAVGGIITRLRKRKSAVASNTSRLGV